MIGILEMKIDTSDCLNNCSNNGECFVNQNNAFKCLCDAFYSGSTCKVDKRPCASNPCLNNGSCVQNLTDIANSTFYCECSEIYKGNFCEIEIDLCQNVTCSYNGKCMIKENKPDCKCFDLYSGEFCETSSDKLKAIRSIASISSTIAILFIIVCYLIFMLSDVMKFFVRKKSFINRNKPLKKNQKIKRKYNKRI